MSLSEIPEEILGDILRYLSIKDQISCSRVNRICRYLLHVHLKNAFSDLINTRNLLYEEAFPCRQPRTDEEWDRARRHQDVLCKVEGTLKQFS